MSRFDITDGVSSTASSIVGKSWRYCCLLIYSRRWNRNSYWFLIFLNWASSSIFLLLASYFAFSSCFLFWSSCYLLSLSTWSWSCLIYAESWVCLLIWRAICLSRSLCSLRWRACSSCLLRISALRLLSAYKRSSCFLLRKFTYLMFTSPFGLESKTILNILGVFGACWTRGSEMNSFRKLTVIMFEIASCLALSDFWTLNIVLGYYG